MKHKVAILFPGQGAQYVGMGVDFYQNYPYVKTIYDLASKELGYDITEICFKDNELINQTKFAQPAILVTSLAIFTVIQNELNLTPDIVAGFSLGEYSALGAASVFDLTSIINLVKERAIYMEEASLLNPGSMAAIIGLDKQVINSLCQEVKGVYPANYNAFDQVVIGGLTKKVNLVCEMAKERGCKRAVMLKVSGPFHTPLMKDASNKMYHAIIKHQYNHPKFDLLMNYRGVLFNYDLLPIYLKKQIESPIYFEEIIKKMIDDGVKLFIEVGPGTVLSGLVKKANNSVKVVSINKVSDLDLIRGGENGIK